MSGVGLTGKTVPLNGGAFPVWEDIYGQGGLRTVPDIAGRNAVSANPLFCKEGMQVYVQSTKLTYQLAADLATWNVAYNQPFKAQYYVDPTFTGLQTGSQSNPFTTIAAAFAAGVALALAAGIITLPVGATVTENVTFPTTGKWELTAPSASPTFSEPTTLNGTVSVSATGNVRHTISNMEVAGAITGDAGATASRLELRDASANAAVDLTATAGGSWTFLFSSGLQAFYQCASTVAVAGSIRASNCQFQNAITFSAAAGLGNIFDGRTFSALSSLTSSSGTTQAFIFNVISAFAGTLTATATTGTLRLFFDGVSAARLMAPGVGLTTVGTVSTTTLDANSSNTATIAANVGVTNLCPKAPAGLYRCSASLELLAQGTLGPTVVLNIIYTDKTGTVQTKAVTPALNILTAAVGTEAAGELVFQHNGSAAIQFSVTGITTPGALSLSQAVVITRLD